MKCCLWEIFWVETLLTAFIGMNVAMVALIVRYFNFAIVTLIVRFWIRLLRRGLRCVQGLCWCSRRR